MKKPFFRRIAAAFAAVVIIATSCPAVLAAEDEKDLMLIDPDMWDISEEGVTCSRRTSEGKAVMFIAAGLSDEPHDITLTSRLAESLDLSDYKELVGKITVSADEALTFTLTYVSDGNETSRQCVVSGRQGGTVYVPLGANEKKADEIRLNIKSDSGSAIRLALTALYADKLFSYSYTERFSAKDVTVCEGTATKTENGIYLPTTTEKKVIELSFLSDTEGSVSAVYINVSGAAAGSVSAEAFLSPSETTAMEKQSAEEPVSVSSAQALYPGSDTYCFIVYDEFSYIRFTFEGLAGDKNDASGSACVFGAGVLKADDAKSGESPGSVTSCKMGADGTLRLSGTLSADAAVKYINASLAVYAIPVWEDTETALSGEPDAVVGISTKFNFSFTPKIKYTNCMYKVLIISDDETVAVDDAVFADCGAISAASRASVSALHGADTAEIFESNVSTVVIDACAGDLLETEDIYSAQLYSYSGNYYYFDTDYISSIDKKVNFCLAEGNTVFIRLLSGKSQETPAFAYSPFDSGSASQLCAVSEYLVKRYSTVGGFIMGNNLNAPGSPSSVAQSGAYLSAMFTETVKSSSPQAMSILPVSDSSSCSAAVFSAMLAYYMDDCGSGTAALMYTCTDNPVTGAYTASHLDNSFGTYALHSADGCLEMWNAPAGMSDSDITATYRSVCKAASAAGLVSAVLSVADAGASPELFDKLKIMLDEEDIFSASIMQSPAKTEKLDYAGSYTLWDFSSSYDSSGWLTGGAFVNCITSASSSENGRVLKAVSDADTTKSGVLVGWLEKPVNASGSSVVVELCLCSGTDSAATVSVVIGSGDSRSEYSANVEYNAPYTLSCDLSSFAGSANVEYIAVIVRSDDAVALEIKNISIASITKTSSALAEAVKSQADTAKRDPAIYIILGFVAAATVTVWAMLIRRRPKRR